MNIEINKILQNEVIDIKEKIIFGKIKINEIKKDNKNVNTNQNIETILINKRISFLNKLIQNIKSKKVNLNLNIQKIENTDFILKYSPIDSNVLFKIQKEPLFLLLKNKQKDNLKYNYNLEDSLKHIFIYKNDLIRSKNNKEKKNQIKLPIIK